MDGTILIADDDKTIRTVLTQVFIRAGCKVRATASADTLWRWLLNGEGDVVICDVNLPDGNGFDILRAIHKHRPNLPFVIISAQNTVLTAIKASDSGAYDYLPKPFDLKVVLATVNKAMATNVSTIVQKEAADNHAISLPLIGSSAAMQQVYRLIARVLKTELPVLITGETGTGKDLIADILHRYSARVAYPFLVFYPSSATAEHMFNFLTNKENIEENSTLYLDEIGDMSDENQLLLLDILRSDNFNQRNIRIISSSVYHIPDLIHKGKFREDLFYRLNVFSIDLPPLRARNGDISELVDYFLDRLAKEGLPKKNIDRLALEKLRQFRWIGNVRQLKNFLSRVVLIVSSDLISVEHLEEVIEVHSDYDKEENITDETLGGVVEKYLQGYFDLYVNRLPPPGLYNRILKEIERPLITLSLSATRGKQTKTAALLGLNRNTLRKKIENLDIQVTRNKKMM